jgi:hypothetical protein
MASLETRAAAAILQLRDGGSDSSTVAHQVLLDAHRAGRSAWSYKLTTLLPDLLAWAGMVEHPLHYTDGPVPSVDWIEADLARYAADRE